MLIESVNDIIAIFCISIMVLIPLYYIIKHLYLSYQAILDKHYQRLMNEDDWHM